VQNERVPFFHNNKKNAFKIRLFLKAINATLAALYCATTPGMGYCDGFCHSIMPSIVPWGAAHGQAFLNGLTVSGEIGLKMSAKVVQKCHRPIFLGSIFKNF
jgi:hypothetical protein